MIAAPLARYWMTRLYVALSVLATIVITTLEPDALGHRTISQAGQHGWFCVWALAGVALVAIADVVVNDLLPEAWRMPTVKRFRHMVYMALAMGLLSISYVIADAVGATALMLRYWLDMGVAVCIAYFDLFARHRGGRKA